MMKTEDTGSHFWLEGRPMGRTSPSNCSTLGKSMPQARIVWFLHRLSEIYLIDQKQGCTNINVLYR